MKKDDSLQGVWNPKKIAKPTFKWYDRMLFEVSMCAVDANFVYLIGGYTDYSDPDSG